MMIAMSLPVELTSDHIVKVLGSLRRIDYSNMRKKLCGLIYIRFYPRKK